MKYLFDMLSRFVSYRLLFGFITLLSFVFIIYVNVFNLPRRKFSARPLVSKTSKAPLTLSSLIVLRNETRKCFSENDIRKAVAQTSNFSFHFVRDRSVLVFSAFLDRRQGVTVRFVGAAVAKMSHNNLFCHIWNPQNGSVETVPAKVQILAFGFNIK